MPDTSNWSLTGHHKLAVEGERVVLLVKVVAPFPSVGSRVGAPTAWRFATPNDLAELVRVSLQPTAIKASAA